jgi:hypothetical protein
MMMIISPSRN